MNKLIKLLFMLSIFTVISCASRAPLVLEGEFPAKKPAFHKYYEGENLPKEKTSLLVGATAQNQTSIYIIGVDDKKSPNKGLIGGSVAAIVLPGKHDITIQIHDKGRITIPLKLKEILLEANTGYLVDFIIQHPEKYIYPDGNDLIKIEIIISNLDTKETIYKKIFNGWGQAI